MDITLERIIKELKNQNKLQQDLTNYLGINYSSFGNWKAGRNKSYQKYLHAIADFLDVSVEYLKGETDQKEKPPIVEDERLKELYDKTAEFDDCEMDLLIAYANWIKSNRPRG
jgi:transcriptional regulator with XRE-family HTH domain